MNNRRSTFTAMAAGAALALGAGGVAVAVASGALADSTPSASASASGSASGEAKGYGRGGHGHMGHPRGEMGMHPQVLHGELVVQDTTGSGTRTILVHKGEVTAATDTSLTVKSSDGFTRTWTVNDTTRGSLDGVAVGDTVHLRGPANGDDAATAEALHEEGVGGMHGPGGRPHGGMRGQDGTEPSQGNSGGAPTVAPSPTT